MNETAQTDAVDVEQSLVRIAAVMEEEAGHLRGEYPLIAEHLHREAQRLRYLTG